MNENVYLKPCPFCGELPEVIDEGDGAKRGNFIIKCLNPACYTTVATTSYLTKKEAIKVWNTRINKEE